MNDTFQYNTDNVGGHLSEELLSGDPHDLFFSLPLRYRTSFTWCMMKQGSEYIWYELNRN